MTQKPGTRQSQSEKVVKDIRRATRKQYATEEKIRIVLDGLKGEDSIAELCRREGIARSLCAAARNKGGAICSNRATIEREVVEDRVLSGLKHRLLSPELLGHFTEEYRKAFNASAAGAALDRQKAAKALTQTETKITSILKAIEDGMYHASMKAKMTELEAEQSRLQSVLAESPEPPALRLHPSLSTRYRELIEDLARSLNAPDVKREAAEALRGLISEVRMVPDPTARNGHTIELVGELAGILCLGGLDATKPPRFARAVSETMVAGSRIGHCCFIPTGEESARPHLLQVQ